MYKIVPTSRFKKDLKTLIKRGYDTRLMDDIVTKLSNGEALAPKHRDHPLSGNYIGKRECHITPDWLLIYEHDNDTLFLYLTRTGTHSDLLKK